MQHRAGTIEEVDAREIAALEEALQSSFRKIDEQRLPDAERRMPFGEVPERFRPRADDGVTW